MLNITTIKGKKKLPPRKNICIIQARTGSTRLPGKVLLKAGGATLLEYMIKRVRLSKKIDKIIIATTNKKEDDAIVNLCKKIKVVCFRGSELDVLDRYYQCSNQYPDYNNVIRLTSDCPLIDPKVIDGVVSFFITHPNLDYVSNNLVRTFPHGMDVEIFTRQSLMESAQWAKSLYHREHVDEYILDSKKYKKGNVSADYNWSGFRLTVDYKEDYEVIKFLIENTKITDDYLTYISLLTRQPQIFLKNSRYNFNKNIFNKLKKSVLNL